MTDDNQKPEREWTLAEVVSWISSEFKMQLLDFPTDEDHPLIRQNKIKRMRERFTDWLTLVDKIDSPTLLPDSGNAGRYVVETIPRRVPDTGIVFDAYRIRDTATGSIVTKPKPYYTNGTEAQAAAWELNAESGVQE